MYSRERNGDEQHGLLVHVPAEHVGAVGADDERAHEALHAPRLLAPHQVKTRLQERHVRNMMGLTSHNLASTLHVHVHVHTRTCTMYK